MKKTLTINLANTVYNIDEDAYQMLQDYFERLRVHFRTEKDADEIMTDIEARFSELFTERLRYGMQVISLKEVQETILIMGNPSDFEQPHEESTHEETVKEESATTEQENTTKKIQKRLYRDIDNSYISGVASGLSQYLNIDVVFVRLFFVLLIFLGFGTIIPIYIVCWIVIPEAKTSAQKLEMRGEEPTIENIKNFVKENVERVADKTEKELKSERTRNFFQQIAEGIISLTRGIAKIAMALIGGFFGCLGFVILLSLVGVLAFSLPFLFSGFSSQFMPYGTNIYIEGINMGALSMYPQFVMALLLFIGIPLGAIAHAIFQKLFNWKRTSTMAGWILVIVWLISFGVTIYYGLHYASEIFLLNNPTI
ncbi:MAG: PspC domain-containing protein [Bacteroidales bacterium]|nr:PspC domain-containing protein [Bacteroidales bacterium]